MFQQIRSFISTCFFFFKKQNKQKLSFIPELYRNTEETAHRHELYYEASSTGEGERASDRHKRKTSRLLDGCLIFGVINTIVLIPVHISHSRRTGRGEGGVRKKEKRKVPLGQCTVKVLAVYSSKPRRRLPESCPQPRDPNSK